MTSDELKKQYNYDEATPMMRQYLDVKFANFDCLVLFRMGDFYELFFEDAVLASNLLGIALTKKGKIGDKDVTMCGVPYHSVENYLNKLIEEGLKVAICDQLETPEEAKKRGGYKAVVKRDITRIITPGTIVEESLLAVRTPNYLSSIVIGKNRVAICSVDLSTSEILVLENSEEHTINELSKLMPREILVSDNLRSLSTITNAIKQLELKATFQVSSFFAVSKCLKVILDFYNISSISAIGELSELQISSIGSIIEYLSLTQKQHLPELPLPKIVNTSNIMSIDSSTRRNLEITCNLFGHIKGTIFDTIDQTITKPGSRLLYKFLSAPLINIDDINQRLDLTDFFYSNFNLTKKIRHILKNISDPERCLTRIAMNKALARDLLSIKYTLSTALEIKGEFIDKFGISLPDNIEALITPLSGDQELYNLIDQAINEGAPNSISDGGIIKPEYSVRVGELYNLIDNSKTYIEKLKVQYQNETGIDNLKILHNNILGLFIEITARNSNKALNSFIHRQTTSNAARYTTIDLQKLENDIVNAKTLVINLEKEIFYEICNEVLVRIKLLRELASSLSLLDVFCNFAHIAYEYNYIRPQLSNDLTFEIIGGRHPVIEKELSKIGKIFINNDCNFSESERIHLITGPNMSGKSTYLRQNAILIILAQIGCFVPAIKAKIGVVDKIFSRIGSGDDLLKGQSTFMVEMLETSAILSQATNKSFIILDEVGRGTSTYDGVSIAWAVLEYVHDKLRSRCLFATHYHELTDMVNFFPALKNYTVAIEESENSILFLYHIIEGFADKSYGIHVAEIAGLPKTVINKAKEMLIKFERSSSKKNKDIIKTESNNLSLF